MIEIEKYRPCTEPLRFRMQYNSFQEAWQACHRDDWMLRMMLRLGVDLLTSTRAKALCASTARHLMKEQPSMRECQVARKAADGGTRRDELVPAAEDAPAGPYA